MEDRLQMRAADGDREEVVRRLRTAMENGRLTMEEYLDRMGLAYQAVTYADLAVLYADLPDAGSMVWQETAPIARDRPDPPAMTTTSSVVAPAHGAFAGLPLPLKILWTIWGAAVSINLVVWVLVSATTGDLIYPWPIWVAGPSGAALVAVSAGVSQIRRSRRSAPRSLPPS